jgi:UrcA family protein
MSSISLKGESVRRSHVQALVLAGCVFCIGSNMAYAAPATADVPSIAVSYSALDLATDEGARNLYSRIAAAGRAVCPQADFRNLSAYARAKTCQSEAIARAVRDVRSPRLAAVYSARAHHG